MPKCELCGCWDLEETAEYVCALSGAKVKRYECKRCGVSIETLDGVTTPMEDHTLEWMDKQTKGTP